MSMGAAPSSDYDATAYAGVHDNETPSPAAASTEPKYFPGFEEGANVKFINATPHVVGVGAAVPDYRERIAAAGNGPVKTDVSEVDVKTRQDFPKDPAWNAALAVEEARTEIHRGVAALPGFVFYRSSYEKIKPTPEQAEAVRATLVGHDGPVVVITSGVTLEALARDSEIRKKLNLTNFGFPLIFVSPDTGYKSVHAYRVNGQPAFTTAGLNPVYVPVE